MVEAFPSDRSNQPFDMAILPRRAWRSRMVTDRHGSKSVNDDSTVRPVAVPKEMARCLVPGKCLGDLPSDPFRRRIRGDVGPQQASPVQAHDHDAIQKPEADRWHHE